MAIETENKLPWGTLRGPLVFAVYLIGLVLIYVGERLIGGQGSARWMLSGLGLLGALTATAVWVWAWMRSTESHRKVEHISALLAMGGLLAVLLYVLGSDLVMGPASLTGAADEKITARDLLNSVWPMVLLISLLPLTFMQWSAATMAKGKGVELLRLLGSARSGATVAMLVCSLFLINASFNKKDVHKDFSYFKTSSPSEATRSMITGLDKDTQALLFFPSPNEVLDEVKPYFKQLSGLSPRFKVQIMDRAMDPEATKKYRVSKDGTVVLVRGEAQQAINLDTKLDKVKRSLKTLDAEFQKSMLKLNQMKSTVYFVSGHGERSGNRIEGEVRPRVNQIKQFLTANNMTVKDLGATEGLSSEVPEDAAVLVWMDPTTALFPGELDSIKKYLGKGGRILLAVEPDNKAVVDDLLAYLGLTLNPAKLAHDRAYIPIHRTPADKYNIVTNSFSSHPSVATVSKYSQGMPVLAPTTGSLDKLKDTDRKVIFVVRSLPNSWADADRDLSRGESERLQTFQIGAAVELKVGDEKKGPAPAKPVADKKDEKEMRAVVFADADLFSDDYILAPLGAGGHPPNYHLFADVVRWLAGEAQMGGVPTSEEDVKILHSRSEDAWWFYSTVMGVPLLILGLGLFTGWGRGRGKRRAGK